MTEPPVEGETHTHERTFTREDVREFAEVSGDAQSRHVEPDDEGRLLVHGLLTATVPTKIGGDLEVLATRMDVRFERPVYTGDTVTCTWRNERVTERDDRYELVVDVSCETDAGTEVLTATVEGLVRKDRTEK